MTRSLGEPRPVTTGRYRYSKLRWRLLVRAFDAAGTVFMRCWRAARPPRTVSSPRRILVLQLDHLGDSVLSTPLLAQLNAAYPGATIEVLASPSNHQVFEADPAVARVRIAARTWFERDPSRWGLIRSVWGLGRSIRREGYDLGIDVRGDVLSVLVMALGGIPRRVGWAMGGGAFLLTDVAEWVPGRHEVESRQAILRVLGLEPEVAPRVMVHVTERDRAVVGAWLEEAWPRRAVRRSEIRAAVARGPAGGGSRLSTPTQRHLADGGDRLHAGRFGPVAPLLAVHVGAGTAAKRWPLRHWSVLIRRFLRDGWRIVVVGGPDDPPASQFLPPHDRLCDFTGRLSVSETAAVLERADLFIGADSGPAHLAASAGTLSVVLFSGTNQPRQWRPWSRYSLILRHRVPCRPCHQKVCPLADHPCMSGLEPDRIYRAAMRWWSRTHDALSPHHPL